jgi:hypothetical protein
MSLFDIYPQRLYMVKDMSCAVLVGWGKVIRREVVEVNKARLDKEVGSSIVNGSPESSEDDTDSMEECFASMYFTVHGFTDESRVAND